MAVIDCQIYRCIFDKNELPEEMTYYYAKISDNKTKVGAFMEFYELKTELGKSLKSMSIMAHKF